MEKKRFIKKKEDFVCEHCGMEVKGDGYTNHCPRCLWSKHVDVVPGDRAALCTGLMKPIKVESEKTGYFIVHRCIKCNFERRNKVSPKDDFDAVVAVQRLFVDSSKV